MAMTGESLEGWIVAGPVQWLRLVASFAMGARVTLQGQRA